MVTALVSEGEIRPDVVYPLKRFQQISGLGDWAMRQARRNGLRVIRKHGRAFVDGTDALKYFRDSDASE